MTQLTLDNLSKSFADASAPDRVHEVLRPLSAKIPSGQFLSIVGPNGCGKTTLLRMIAGLESAEEKTLTVDGKQPGAVRTGVVFQNYSETLLPWLTGQQNILFPFHLQANATELPAAKERLRHLLFDISLDSSLTSYPYTLSSGQQQLVAILRALVYNPALLLLDEPFSGLDPSNRRAAHQLVLRHWEANRSTVILVTHSLDEALLLSDRVLVLDERPASIVADTEVPFERPREPNLVTETSFLALRQSILNANRSIAV